MKHTITPMLFLIFPTLTATAAFAQSSEKADLRESCRRAVAGEYISVYDAVTTGRAAIKQLEDMSNRVAAAHKDADKELKALKLKVDHVNYDVALSDQLIHQSERVRGLAATLELYREQISTARGKFILAESREGLLRKALSAVFEVKRGTKHDKDFPIAIDYKAPCPRFRFMCPLPASYHDALAAIPVKPESAEVCKRYIGYSMSGKK